MNNRIGNKWTVNEVLSLQREFELLGWSINQIAKKHGRTANAIMYKLDQEGLADYNILYADYHNLDSRIHSSKPSLADESEEDGNENDDNEDDGNEDGKSEDTLSSRMSKLETELCKIKDLLTVINQDLKLYARYYCSNGIPRGCDY